MATGELKQYKAVIFDLDGVIINSEPIHMDIINEIVSQYGQPLGLKEYNEQLVGRGEHECCSLLKRKYGMPQTVEEIIGLYKDGISHYFETVDDLPVLPGVMELIQTFHEAGLLIGVASSSSNRNIRLSLEHAGLAEYFSARCSAEDVQHGKPSPDVYLQACGDLAIKPNEGIAIEDSAAGVTAAKTAGLYTIGFINPDSGNQDLSKADCTIAAFEELRFRV